MTENYTKTKYVDNIFMLKNDKKKSVLKFLIVCTMNKKLLMFNDGQVLDKYFYLCLVPSYLLCSSFSNQIEYTKSCEVQSLLFRNQIQLKIMVTK